MWARSERDEKKFVANEFCSDSSLQDSMRLRPHCLCTAGSIAMNVRTVRGCGTAPYAGPLRQLPGGTA